MKRALDFSAALLGLVLTSPLLLGAALAIKLDSPGPALYHGPRVGRNGTAFQIHKLRTMVVQSDVAGPAVTAADDVRVTRVGRVLRRTKLDELPQLFNVLTGEMSLVGPRPEHPRYVSHYSEEQRRLLDLRPGMTGPATLEFIDEEELLRGGSAESTYITEVMPKKLDLELQYQKRASLARDLWILVRTALTVARRPVSGA